MHKDRQSRMSVFLNSPERQPRSSSIPTRSSSRSSIASSNDQLLFHESTRSPVVLGICAMDVKARSKAMREIITRVVERAQGAIDVKVFGDKVILDEGMSPFYLSLNNPVLSTHAAIQMSKIGRPVMFSSLSFPLISPWTRQYLTSNSVILFASMTSYRKLYYGTVVSSVLFLTICKFRHLNGWRFLVTVVPK